MKDGLFEMLMNFFEKSLSQLKENGLQHAAGDEPSAYTQGTDKNKLFVKSPGDSAVRVFTYEERLKFTKPSYQFLMKMMLWGVIASETLEQIIHKLFYSDSRFVTLQETKWAIRTVLADDLTSSQLAFLDLVLYQKEDDLPLH